MKLLQLFRGQNDCSSRRLYGRRRPLVETLEGRQLLSTFGVTAQAIQGGHPGSQVVSAAIVGSHIGVVAEAIQGSHIGVVAEAIQGSHIGVVAEAIQGSHIGTNLV